MHHRPQTSSKIDGPGSMDRNGNSLTKTQQFSFGVSRVEMKKIHVDEILSSKEVKPAPSAYKLKSTFGTGNRYSMRPMNDLWSVHLKK
jgi:hypothetical protein